eukprot:1902393-Pyramimonas_sp.AAC.1
MVLFRRERVLASRECRPLYSAILLTRPAARSECATRRAHQDPTQTNPVYDPGRVRATQASTKIQAAQRGRQARIRMRRLRDEKRLKEVGTPSSPPPDPLQAPSRPLVFFTFGRLLRLTGVYT